MQQISQTKYQDSWTQQVVCPWCSQPIKVPIEIVIINRRAPAYARQTHIAARNISTVHRCVDPTGPGS